MQKSQLYPTSEGHCALGRRARPRSRLRRMLRCTSVLRSLSDSLVTAASIARKVHPRGAGGVGMIPRQCIVERRDSHRFEMVFELVETEIIQKATHEFNVFFVGVTRAILYQYTVREGARVSTFVPRLVHGCRMAAWPPPLRRCSSHIHHKTMKRRPACAGQRKTFKYHRRCWMKCRTQL